MFCALVNRCRALIAVTYTLFVLIHIFFIFWTTSKQRRVEFDDAVDDVIPIALAQKLRERLAKEKAETSSANEDVEKKKPRGKKADHLYCRQNPTEFISCIQSLTPRQKEAVNELGFGAVLDFNIREIPWYLAYRVLKSFNLARCEIQLSGGEP